ncbi:hypothetical protein PHYPSEUDO_007973 [Phytophthora pseudosyringae]|uniref:Uncharacterized protein n=1 Tax=Phytophthora pseudosyringae TaxID=221518 RepID=A0A8T1WE35_9STRA|nr:hypothetical protein PHYPSEUDO_007973 [Phytophthora pseudosyringae]
MPPLRALLLSNGDADAPLELALLQLWAAPDPECLPTQLLALDDKCWRRLGLLLFASDNSLVLALVAALERVAAGPPRSSDSSDRLLRRMWRSQWREHLREKVVDCRLRLEREGAQPEGAGRTDPLSEVDLVAPRLVQILVTSLRTTLISYHDDQVKDQIDGTVDGGNDAPKSMEVVDLLLSLSTTVERTPAVAQAAAMGLQSLLSLDLHAFSGLVTTHICRSAALQHYVTWLLGDDGSVAGACPTSTSEPCSAAKLGRRAYKEQHECDHVYLELLVAAAAAARPDANKRRGARSPVLDDTAAMLQICTLGVANPDANIQHVALCLLCSLLVLDDASSSALSSAVRLSGILITLSWLLNHTVSHIAAMAATTLELIIRHSPPSDILRAVIEQGCVIIYRALLSTSSGATKSAAQAAVAASCRSLLNWVTGEVAWQSGVVAASVQSILRSTNVLLQKNIVLTLQILAQRNAAIREALEDHDFRADALVAAIQADDEAGLAVSLLSVCLNCCDKCSTLKIEGCTRDSNVFHQQHDNNNPEQQEEEPVAPPLLADEQHHAIQLRCADGELVETTAALLREHSNLLRGWKVDNPHDPEGDNSVVLARLGQFRAASVQLFVDLLPMAQQDAVSALTELQSFPMLQELLHLANAVGSAKCWHTTTSAICRMMTASNWLDIFQFASTEVRHPTLVLRCIRFALQLHSSFAPRDTVGRIPQPEKQSQIDPVEQEHADLTSALKTAAIQMSQELFIG